MFLVLSTLDSKIWNYSRKFWGDIFSEVVSGRERGGGGMDWCLRMEEVGGLMIEKNERRSKTPKKRNQ